MGTHAVIGIKDSTGKISGCYLHYDGSTVGSRIKDYLKSNTTTCLYMVITKAQAAGGLRSFPPDGSKDFLQDDEPYIIDEKNWKEDHYGSRYSYLIDYSTGEIKKRSS